MPIQIPSGTIRDTLTAAATTKTLLCDFIKDEVVAAGWTVASGASGAWVLDSAIFNANQIRITVDNLGTNCARVQCKKVNDTQAQTNFMFVLPGVAWRQISYNQQFFLFVPGTEVARGNVMVSALYTPSDILGSPTPNAIAISNAISDTDATNRFSFRSIPHAGSGGMSGTVYCNYNGTFWNAINSVGIGWPQISIPRGDGNNAVAQLGCQTYKDGSKLVTEPLVGFGNTGQGDVAEVAGQLWGMFITSEVRALDTTITFNGRTYRTVGVYSAASNPSRGIGSLMALVA